MNSLLFIYHRLKLAGQSHELFVNFKPMTHMKVTCENHLSK